VRAVMGFVPPLGRANFILSPASEVVEVEGLVECTIVTSNPIRVYGVFHWPESSE
jgi:hypothetical protein